MMASALPAESGATEADARFVVAQVDARCAAALARVHSFRGADVVHAMQSIDPPKSRAKGSPDRPRRSAAAAARPAPRGAGPAPRTIQRMHATRTVWTKEQRRPPQDRTGQAPTQPQSRAQTETRDGRVHRACFLVDLLFFPLVARARHRQGRQRKETVPLCATIQPCLHVLRGPCKRFLRRARTRGPAGEGAMTRTTRRREALGLLFCK